MSSPCECQLCTAYNIGVADGMGLGLEKAAKIIHQYRQASEAYAKEPEGGYMKGLWRAEMLIMDGGHGAS